MSNKVVHPFFQQQQQKKASSSVPPKSLVVNNLSIHQAPSLINTPTPIETRDPVGRPRRVNKPKPIETPKLIETPKTRLRARKKVSSSPSPSSPPSLPVTKVTAIEHVPAVASSSTPYYVPILKPKFYSDTLEYKAKKQHEALYNFYGRIPTKEKKYDHEFSRFNRDVFGNGHITQQTFVNVEAVNYFPRRSVEQINDSIQSGFFTKKTRISHPKLKKPKFHVTITNEAELQDFLDRSFPHWNTFSSCVILSQLVFNKSNARKINQQKSWIDTYRPKSVNGLLGDRYNYVYLKDWLHQMKIAPMSAPKPNGEVVKKRKSIKKKKVVDSLDELLDNDEDEDFMPVKKSAKQVKNESIKSNIILLAGDCGVGKTTLVYTAAEQLGYEVFEINPGSRRSGKDIMSMVGEMTKSHLVTFASQKVEEPALKKPKKRTLNPCLSSKAVSKEKNGLMKNFLRTKSQPPPIKRQQSSEPKQSLILLEEVDILFEDDKAFWTSVIELSQKSKRPIIMTCNDPEQIPFESLYLQVILEIKPPSDAELLPYLWLVCYSEGYIVDPADLICLMAFLGRDIRQLIQTLELYVKNDQSIFDAYLGISSDDMKLKCIPSRVAVDTFRLARCYRNMGDTKMTDDNDDDDFDKIVKALDDNALVDSWLGWKGNGNLIHDSAKDQISGFTTLWLEEEETVESKCMLDYIESTVTVVNSETMVSNVWSNVILDESSHWDEACDARSRTFDDYVDAIARLLVPRMVYQPNEYVVMMDYVPYVQQMISAHSKAKAVKTRSKRKRLYLPLSDDNVDILTHNRSLVDETEFWINRLCRLKKDSRNA